MTLFAELGRPLPRVPHPSLPKRKCALEIEADKAAQSFGGVAREPRPSVDVIAKVEAMLLASTDAVDKLGRQELKVVPYLIWGASDRWRKDPAFIRRYLALVHVKWRAGLRRIWRHYALNYDPACPATIETAAWLSYRRQQIPELLRSFSNTYHMLEVSEAAKTFASAVLSGEQIVDDIEAVGLHTAVIRSSALCVEVLAAAGQQLPILPGTPRIVQRLEAFLNGTPGNAIAEAVCGEPARARALRSLTDGLVEWQEGHDPKDENPDPALDFLLALNGDPRFVPDRWRGHVSPRSISAMERWLSRKTIEAFFRVIDALRTDRQDMWQARRSFWLSYLPHVSKAWLVIGPDATVAAEKEGIRFGRFAPGSGTQYDHCGLLLQIRDLCIMEMNKNGSAIFWQSGARGLPGLYEETYSRHRYRSLADNKQIVTLTHQGDWQRKFRTQILQMTGVNVRQEQP